MHPTKMTHQDGFVKLRRMSDKKMVSISKEEVCKLYGDKNQTIAKICRKLDITRYMVGRILNISDIKRKSRIADLTGERFGFLKIKSFAGKKKGKIFWNCECSCGNPHCKGITTVPSTSVKYGSTRSCGNNRRTSCGEIPGVYICSVKRHAEVRGLTYNLEMDYLWGLLQGQKGECKLSGIPISFADKTASLDRIDSTIGYEIGNVQWIHKTVNIMKNRQAEDDFLRFCRAIVAHNDDLGMGGSAAPVAAKK